MRMPSFVAGLIFFTALGILTVHQQVEIIHHGYEISRRETQKEKLTRENRVLRFYQSRYSSLAELKQRIARFKLGLLAPEECRAISQSQAEGEGTWISERTRTTH